MKDFIYYRCSGSDGYRFGGEAICPNKQVQRKFLETAVWQQLCELLRNPRTLQHEYESRRSAEGFSERVENFKAQRLKLQHAMERLIDGFTEGLIGRNSSSSAWIELGTGSPSSMSKSKADTGEFGHLESVRLAMKRLHELSAAIGHDLASADWQRKREIIRILVQRIEIDTDVIKLIFRLTQNARGSDDNSS